MRESLFRFKKFDCRHSSSSMKIGVDAVLVGAWSDVSQARTILDVGTGCGVISLMCAQRNASAQILAIDIHEGSVKEAALNFSKSPWSNRLEAELRDFSSCTLRDIDLIISNPPYFDSGVVNPDTVRLKARHQDALSPKYILERGRDILSDTGMICMIVPAEQSDNLISYASALGYGLDRTCNVKGNAKAAAKRTLLQFVMGNGGRNLQENLTLEISPNVPTEEYRSLCKEFYLKF